MAYYGLGQFQKAIEHYQKAVIYIRNRDSVGNLSTFLSNQGLAYRELGEYEKALKLIKESIHILEEADSNFDVSLAISYNVIAGTYKDLGMYENARHFYIKSLELRKKRNNVHRLATIYNNLAQLEESVGNYNQALVYYNKTLSYEKKADNPIRKAIPYRNIAGLYVDIGDYEKARFYFAKSIQIYRQFDNPAALAEMWAGLAALNRVVVNYDSASIYYRKAARIYKQHNNKSDLFDIYVNLSQLELDAGQYTKAREMAEEALSLARQMKSNLNITEALIIQGQIYQVTGKHEKAENRYRLASTNAARLPPNEQIPALRGLARSLYHNGDTEEAFEVAEQAISYMETIRKRGGYMAAFRASVFEAYVPFYKQLASWYISSGQHFDRAFALLESSKARAFTEDLARASSNFEATLPDSLRIKKQEYMNKLNRLYTQIDTVSSNSIRSELKSRIIEEESNYEAFLNELDLDKITRKQIKATETITLKQLQRKLPAQTAVLEYALLDSTLLVMGITDDGIYSRQLSYSTADFSDKHDFRRTIESFINKISSKGDISDILNQSNRISTLLLNEFREIIDNHEDLLIIPDGFLAYLPFETLVHNGEYLIQTNNVKYLPSVTSRSLLNRNEGGNKAQLLAMAGSQFEGEIEFDANRRQAQVSLPYTVTEVDSVASLFEDKTVWKDEELTEQALKSEPLSSYKYIHFATHGIIDESDSHNSGLVLTESKLADGSIGDDGFLRTTEIFNLNMNADMVVLSACNTGKGRLIEGEGILGLQRAVFTAGASNLVVSLWSVYDKSTAFMIPEFYRQLLDLEGQFRWDALLRYVGLKDTFFYGHKATAMRNAKRKMIDHPTYNHPVFWAPFIVVGA